MQWNLQVPWHVPSGTSKQLKCMMQVIAMPGKNRELRNFDIWRKFVHSEPLEIKTITLFLLLGINHLQMINDKIKNIST